MKHNKKRNSIIYVNFPPYDNTGKILDFLKLKYTYIFHFSFNFHRLTGTKNNSTFSILKNGKCIEKTSLFQILPPPQLIFVLLPIRSIFFLMQIIRYGHMLSKRYGKIDDYFTVNAFTAWCGLVLKKLGFVGRTIFWVWDYYPPIDKNKVIMFMRWLYWQFDKLGTRSDKVIFLNSKLQSLRKAIHIIPIDQYNPIVGIGTTYRKIRLQKSKISLLFIGVLKKTQGLDLLLDHSGVLKKTFPTLCVHIIGSGPDEQYFKVKAKESEIPFYFHGLLNIYSRKATSIIQKTNVGIAMYKPEPGNVSYFGDPSKIKNYISYGLPVITTNVFEFSKEIQHSGVGLVIPYTVQAFIISLKAISKKHKLFSNQSIKLAKKYEYTSSYERMFSE